MGHFPGVALLRNRCRLLNDELLNAIRSAMADWHSHYRGKMNRGFSKQVCTTDKPFWCQPSDCFVVSDQQKWANFLQGFCWSFNWHTQLAGLPNGSPSQWYSGHLHVDGQALGTGLKIYWSKKRTAYKSQQLMNIMLMWPRTWPDHG